MTLKAFSGANTYGSPDLRRHGLAKPAVTLHRCHRSASVVTRCQQNNPAATRRGLLGAAMVTVSAAALNPALAAEQTADLTPMDALKGKDYGKSRMRYPDYVSTPSGLQYQDFREGQGEPAKDGDSVVVDWAGYTIGYYGRPFEARNKPKGSSFTGDNKEYLRFVLGQQKLIPGFEEAVTGMKAGGIRRIVVPEELGYPTNNWKQLGPIPTTFAGERALDFVLNNKGMIDKTLLFDIELIRIDR